MLSLSGRYCGFYIVVLPSGIRATQVSCNVFSKLRIGLHNAGTLPTQIAGRAHSLNSTTLSI